MRLTEWEKGKAFFKLSFHRIGKCVDVKRKEK